MYNKLKKFAVCFVLLLVCQFAMSGCSAEENRVIVFAQNNFRQAANDRVTANLNRLNQLYESGWVSKENYESAKKSIEAAQKSINELASKLDAEDGQTSDSIRKILDNHLMKAATYLHPLTEDDGVVIEIHVGEGDNSETYERTLHGGDNPQCYKDVDKSKDLKSRIEDYYTATDLEDLLDDRSAVELNVVSNFLKFHVYKDGIITNDGYWDKISDSKFQEITIVPESTGDMLDEGFNAEVWKLKPTLTVTNINGTQSNKSDAAKVNGLASDYSIDGVVESVAQTFGNVKDGEITEEKLGPINVYFERATDENKEAIKLFDKTGLSNSGYSIVGDSKKNIGTPGSVEARDELGYDMWVKQYGKPVLTLRFKEFIDENIDNLQKLLGNGGTKYIIVAVKGSKGSVTHRAYLLEYPIYYAKGFSYDSGKITADMEKSNLSINFRTKGITKYYSRGDADVESYGKIVASVGGELYPTNGSLSPRQDGNASFIIRGGVDVPIAYKAVDGTAQATGKGNSSSPIFLNGQKSQVAKIILRDYLEVVYAPDFVKDENTVAFGRKLRFVYDEDNWEDKGNNEYDLVWNTTDDMLKYVDMDGHDVEDMPKLNYTKVCSFNGLADNEVRQFPQANQSLNSTIRKEQQSTGTMKVGDIKVVTTNYVVNGTFPGEYVGFLTDYQGKYDLKSSDASADHTNLMVDNQLFYAIALNTDLFETNLFSKWINSADIQANSLEWWNKWLGDNHYVYKIDHQELNEYLQGNYSYEMGDSGVLIINLDTIGKIREDMIKEKKESRNTLIRTVFVIMGWALVALAVFIPLCWVFDTNIGLGVNLTEKITFGHYIPVKYSEDMPEVFDDDVRYMGFKQVMVATVVLITTGIILINVNVYDVVVWLIHMFGNFGTIVGNILKR